MEEPRTADQQGFLAAELQQQSNIGSILNILKVVYMLSSKVYRNNIGVGYVML